MAKAPPNLPERGDRVRLRSRAEDLRGTLGSYNPDNNWSWVKWDYGPKVCHRYELERITEGEKRDGEA